MLPHDETCELHVDSAKPGAQTCKAHAADPISLFGWHLYLNDSRAILLLYFQPLLSGRAKHKYLCLKLLVRYELT